MKGPSNLDQFSYSDCERSRPGNDERFQKITLAAWSLLLSQRQDFSNNHLARVPITLKQEGTKLLKDEVLPSVSAKDMDTGGYQVSDRDDIEFYRKIDHFDVDAVFRPGIDTPPPPPPTALDDLEIGESAENPNELDKQEDKDNSTPTTSVSERATRRPPTLLRSKPFATKMENVSDQFIEICYNKFQCVCGFLSKV